MHCCQCKSEDCLHYPPSNSQLSVPVNQPVTFLRTVSFWQYILCPTSRQMSLPGDLCLCSNSSHLSLAVFTSLCAPLQFLKHFSSNFFSLLLPELMDYLDLTLDHSNDCVVPFAHPLYKNWRLSQPFIL